MEYAKVELICKNCKNTFIFTKACHNRLEAEQIEHKARHRRRPLCPSCLKQEQEAADQEKAAEMGLPELIGISEKQIHYAFSLRSRYIKAHPGAIMRTKKLLDNIDFDKAKAAAKKNGFADPEDCIAAAFRQQGLYFPYLCLTECNAQIIIESIPQKF